MSYQNPTVTARPRLLEAGLFLVIVALPLIFSPVAVLSFGNPKFAFLVLGTTLIASSGSYMDRRLALVAAMWVLALILASIAGLDPWWSLVGAEYQNMGVITLGAAAFLMCSATGLDEHLRSRLPYWLFWTGVSVAAIAVVTRFVQYESATWRFDPYAATVGHRVFVGAVLAAALLAATAIRRRWVHYVGLLTLGSGLAVSVARSSWIGAVLGLMVVVLAHHRHWRTVVATAIPVIIAVTGWTLISSSDALPQTELGYSAAPRFLQLDEGSALERPPAARAYLRGWMRDPLLGSGPGTGWHVFLTNATEDELRAAGRGFGDAHNLVIELGATSGLVGLLPLLALGTLAFRRLMHAPTDRTWALGATVALATVHSLQPLNIVITPLMFLTAGLALRSPTTRDGIRVHRSIAIVFAVALLLAWARFISASFEQYGLTYASESAYRWSLRFEPRRLDTALLFANHRAFDYRTDTLGAESESRRLVQQAIRQHSWSPRVRLVGANIMLVLDDVEEATRLVEEHLEMFPNDGEALAAAAALALRRGDHVGARALARHALRIFDHSLVAQNILIATRNSEQAQPRGR